MIEYASATRAFREQRQIHQTDWLVYDAVEGQKRLQKTSVRLRIWADYTTLGAGCQIFWIVRLTLAQYLDILGLQFDPHSERPNRQSLEYPQRILQIRNSLGQGGDEID